MAHVIKDNQVEDDDTRTAHSVQTNVFISFHLQTRVLRLDLDLCHV